MIKFTNYFNAKLAYFVILFLSISNSIAYGQNQLQEGASAIPPSDSAAIRQMLRKYQENLSFLPNMGQFTDKVLWQVSNGKIAARFLQDGVSFSALDGKSTVTGNDTLHTGFVWNIKFKDINPQANILGKGKRPGNYQYLETGHGQIFEANSELWYENFYPGADLRYYSGEKGLEYDFVVQPHTDFTSIKWNYEGVSNLEITPDGDIRYETPLGEIIQHKPYAYQYVNDVEVPVEMGYTLSEDGALGFGLQGDYDENLPLVIDPLFFEWATLLGGNGVEDFDYFKVENDGVYLIGYLGTSAPLISGMFGGSNGRFLAKFQLNGELVYFKYLPINTVIY